MSQSITVTLDLPKDWKQFRLPPALNERLQELLDRQDEVGRLTAHERREAQALVELVDVLSMIKAQITRPQTRKKSVGIPTRTAK